MSMRDTFDCTPQQYHHGLDLLWDALKNIGITSVEGADTVFTLVARHLAFLHRVAKMQSQHGRLQAVVLKPCQCGRYVGTELYINDLQCHHEKQEWAGIEEARELYQLIFGRISIDPNWPIGLTNFLVTDESTTCSQCGGT